LLVSALREAGFRVLGKTTGSRAMLLFPGGGEAELARRGRPSVLEQIKVLHRAAGASADAVVTEMMAIRPELLRVESLRILQPHILILTNARIDHTEYWGPSRETAARCLAAAMAPGCAVFVADDDMLPVWEEEALRRGARLHPVGLAADEEASDYGEPGKGKEHDLTLEFKTDVTLAQAVTDYLEIDRAAARRGFRQALPDLGSLRIWRWRPQAAALARDCVNAFAANDPASTRLVIHKLSDLGFFGGRPVFGLLNLRRDRGDRTLQWVEAFRAGAFPELAELFVVGEQARVFERLTARRGGRIQARALRGRKAEEIMAGLGALTSAPAVILGMGNMAGAGRKLVEYWEREGEGLAV